MRTILPFLCDQSDLGILFGQDHNWEEFGFETHDFSRLASLFLEKIDLEDAGHLVSHPGLMRCLMKLYLTIPETSTFPPSKQKFKNCVQNLCQNARSLTYLSFRPFDLADTAILQPLRSLNLMTLDLDMVEIEISVARVLLTLSPGLKHLNVRLLKAPATFLEDLALQFPTLCSFTIKIEITKNLGERGLKTPIKGPLCLRDRLMMEPETRELAEPMFFRSVIEVPLLQQANRLLRCGKMSTLYLGQLYTGILLIGIINRASEL